MRAEPKLKQGHGLCPQCTDPFDLTNSTLTFAEKNGCDALLYVFCDDCTYKFNHDSSKARQNMMNECFMNVKVRFKSLPTHVWACTTLITLWMNGGNLSAAYENGSGLPENIYKGISDGDIEMTLLSFYLNMCKARYV